MENDLLPACYSTHSAIEEEYYVPRLHKDFSNEKKTGTQLNSLFGVMELRGMLEDKSYKSVDATFPVLAAFIDRFTR